MSSFNKKTRNPGFKPNEHWVECERSGMAIRASDARKEWNGLIVAKEEYEPRHPQDFLRTKEDDQSPVGLHNSESADVLVNTGNSDAREAIAGVAVAGVAVAGFEFLQDTSIPSGTFTTPTGQVAPA